MSYQMQLLDRRWVVRIDAVLAEVPKYAIADVTDDTVVCHLVIGLERTYGAFSGRAERTVERADLIPEALQLALQLKDVIPAHQLLGDVRKSTAAKHGGGSLDLSHRVIAPHQRQGRAAPTLVVGTRERLTADHHQIFR